MTKFTSLATALAVSGLVLFGTVACSAIGKPSARPSASAGSDHEHGLKFAQCMRDHGEDVPDPGGDGTVTGDGGTGGTPGTLDASADAINLPDSNGEAFQACRQFLPNGGEVQKLTAAELAQQVRFAQCMRAHGIDYPDPNPDGTLQGFSAPSFGDQAAMQRIDDAERACEAATSPAPAK